MGREAAQPQRVEPMADVAWPCIVEALAQGVLEGVGAITSAELATADGKVVTIQKRGHGRNGFVKNSELRSLPDGWRVVDARRGEHTWE